MDKQLIQKFFKFQWELLEDDEAKKQADEQGFLGILKAVGMGVGRITDNGTLYRRSLIFRELDKLKPKMADGRVVALVDHPLWMPSVMQEGVRWLEAKMDENHNVVLKGGILDTDPGRHLHGARKGGVKHGVSSRGWGTTLEKEMDEDYEEWELNKDKKGEKFREVQDDFDLETWDIVSSPSNKPAWTEDEQREALLRLEQSITGKTPEEENTDMEIKTLEDLRKVLDGTIVETILAAHKAEVKDDLLAEILSEQAEDVATKVDEALADSAKICAAIGLSEDDLDFVKKNMDSLKLLAESDFVIPAALQKAARNEPEPDNKDDKIQALMDQISELQSQMGEATTEIALEKKHREGAEQALIEKDQQDALDEALKNGVAGKVLATQIEIEARKNLDLGASDEDVAKAIEEAEKYVNEIVDASKGPSGKGKTGSDAEGGSDPGVNDVNARRKAFKESHPTLAVPAELHRIRPALIKARLSAKEQQEWLECFGPESIRTVPLADGFLD